MQSHIGLLDYLQYVSSGHILSQPLITGQRTVTLSFFTCW